MADPGTTRLSFLLRLRDHADTLTWQQFHERYGELLYRYARSRGASHADAEDIVQEVELGLFKALGGFEYDARKGRFRAYLRAAVVHAMKRRAQRQDREPVALDPQRLDYLTSHDEASSDAEWERQWQLHRLRWALRSVAGHFESQTLRAFELHVLGGLSVEKTATELGLSKASVYQARHRVLKALRERLAELDPDGDI